MAFKHIEKVSTSETKAFSVNKNLLKKSKIFKDNIEHLEALEYIARIMLAIAYLNGGNTAVRGPGPRIPYFYRVEKDLCIKEPDLSFLGLSSEKINTVELKALLDKVKTKTKQRVKNALREGIELKFENFCSSHDLDEFERIVMILMIANNTAKGFRDLYGQCQIDPHDRLDGGMSIGAILCMIHSDYRDQLASRKYFNIDAPLIKH